MLLQLTPFFRTDYVRLDTRKDNSFNRRIRKKEAVSNICGIAESLCSATRMIIDVVLVIMSVSRDGRRCARTCTDIYGWRRGVVVSGVRQ